MRSVYLVQIDKVRPALVLTRALALPHLRNLTVAPITSTIRGYATEVNVGPRNGLDHNSVINCDAIQTVPATNLVRQVGFLLPEQEDALSEAIRAAFDLD